MEGLLQTRRGGLTPNGCDLEVGSSHLYTSYTRYRCNRPEFGWGLERRGPIGTRSGGVRRALPGIRSSVSLEGSKLDTSGSYGRRSAHFSNLRSVHRPEATGFSSFRKGEQRGSSCPSASYGFNEFFVKRRILAFATQNGFAECSSSGHIPGTWPRGKREATQLRCSAYGHSQSNYEDPLIRQEGDAIAGESIPPRQPSSASWMLRLWKARFNHTFSNPFSCNLNSGQHADMLRWKFHNNFMVTFSYVFRHCLHNSGVSGPGGQFFSLTSGDVTEIQPF